MSEFPKIGKLIRLLASDQEGEILASVRAIDRLLKAAGKSFNDLATALDGKVMVMEAPKSLSTHYSDACKWLLTQPLEEKEKGFILDMQRRFKFNIDFTPSEKQKGWFTSIVKKYSEKADA